MTEQTIEEGKGLAIVSYITIFGIIISYFLNRDKKNDFSAFHLRQSIGIWLSFHLIGIVVSTIDSSLVRLVYFSFFCFLFIFGLICAIGGKLQTVPLLGEFFQKTFANIGK